MALRVMFLLALLVASPVTGEWNATIAVKDLDAVEEALHKIVDSPLLTGAQLVAAKRVVDDVERAAEEVTAVQSGQGLGKEKRPQQLASAIKELQGLQEQWALAASGNRTAMEEKMHALQSELAQKQALLNRTEGLLKLVKMRKELADEKLQLKSLLDAKSKAEALEHGKLKHANQQAVANKLVLAARASAANKSAVQANWTPARGVKDLNAVEAALHKVADSPLLAQGQLASAKRVVEDVERAVAAVQSGQGLTKEKRQQQLAGAIKELQGLQDQWALVASGNKSAMEEKMHALQRELAQKQALLNRTEGLLKLAKMQKELADEKLELKALLDAKSKAKVVENEQLKQAHQRAVANTLVTAARAVNKSAAQGNWTPTRGVKDLDVVEAALHQIVDSPSLTGAQLVTAKRVVADVEQAVAAVKSGHGLTKEKRMQQLASAIEELKGLQEQWALVASGNKSAMEEKMHALQSELAQKQAVLNRTEGLLKLVKMRKELADGKLQLRALLDAKSKAEALEHGQLKHADQQAVASMLATGAQALPVNKTATQANWTPARGVKDLDAVEAALHKIVDSPMLTGAQLVAAKRVVADVEHAVAAVQSGQGLTKEKRMVQLASAIKELQDLQEQWALAASGNRTAMEEKMHALQRELAQKQALLNKTEGLLKLVKMRKELADEKLQLKALLDAKSKAEAVEHGEQEHANQRAVANKLVLAALPANKSAAQTNWTPARGVKDLDAVEASLHKLVDSPLLKGAQLAAAKRVVEDVDRAVAAVQSGKGLKEGRMQQLAGAIQELQGLREQWALVASGNRTALEAKLHSLQSELAEKHALLNRTEGLLKLTKLRRELADEKLQLKGLLDSKLGVEGLARVQRQQAQQRAAANELVAKAKLAAANGSAAQAKWTPARGVKDLDDVEAALRTVVDSPMTSGPQLVAAKRVVEDVNRAIEAVRSDKGLTKEQRGQRLAGAIKELRDLQEQWALVASGNRSAIETKLQALKQQLAQKQAILNRTEGLLKLANMRKELAQEKLQLKALMDSKSKAESMAKEQQEEAQQQEAVAELVADAQRLAVNASLAKNKTNSSSHSLPGPLNAILADLKARARNVSASIERADAAEKAHEADAERVVALPAPTKAKTDAISRGRSLLKALVQQERRAYRKARAAKEAELAELREGAKRVEAEDLPGLETLLAKMQREAKTLQAKSRSFLH